MDTPKKIVFLLSHAPFLITHRLEIARGARALGLEVHVIAPHDAASAEMFAREGFSYHPVPLHRGSLNPLRELVTLVHIARILRTIRPHIVHSVALKCVLYSGLISYLVPIPKRVGAISGLGFVFISSHLKMRLLRLALIPLFKLALAPKNTVTIFQNPDDRALFIESRMLHEKDTVMIRGSGVDTALFTPPETPPAEPLRITMVARFLSDKGTREFIEAARILKQKHPKVQCTLVGFVDPANPSSLAAEEIEKAVQEGIIINLGERSDIAEIYRASHIACLPSYREGLPKSLLEAAACGLPIVTTDAPGCREVVEDGQNGLLVPVKNAALLAKALITLIESPALRAQMGASSRLKAVQEFSIGHVVQMTLPLYAERT